MDKIAVLIPCYNEETTIGKVIDDFKVVLPEATIYVYDNNSTDHTLAVAAAHGAVVRRETKQGKGHVVRRMFREVEAECYVMTDGDDTYPADFAQKLCEPIWRGEADMVVGDRLSATYFEENERPFHNFGNRLVRKLINSMFHSHVKDIMTGYRAFSRFFVKNMPVTSSGFEIETEMTIHALDKNFSLAEIPVDFRNRPQGSVSKLNTLTDGFKVICTVIRLFRDYRPYAFFSSLSLLLSVAALTALYPVLCECFATGLVPRFPTLIVCGFVLLLAILLFIGGVILEVINRKHRQLYELLLLRFQEAKKKE